jgi:hypothetical protein
MEQFRFFNEHVLVSNYGRVSFLKYKNAKVHTTFGNNDKSGYLRIMIEHKHYSVHRLVWQVFNGEIPDGYIIHHLDGNKHNNNLCNLCLMENEEHKKHHSTGENNPNYGKHRSDETKRKIGDAQRGKIITEESRIKMSESHKDKMFGENNPFYGKKHTKETRRKISEANKLRFEKLKQLKSSLK